MKHTLILSLLFSLFVFPLVSIAADETVIIKWSMPTESIADIQNYILNYSQNSDMLGAVSPSCGGWQQTDTQGDQTFYSMTCSSVLVIEGQPTYFTLEAENTEGTSFVSNIFTKGVKPASVTNFKIVVSASTSSETEIEDIGSLIEAESAKYISPTQIWAYKLPDVPSHNGTLKSISITADGLGSSRRFKLALYTHDEVNNLPGELVLDSTTVEGVASGDTPELMTLNIASGSPQIVNGSQYWILIQALDKYFQYYRDYDANSLTVTKTSSAYDWGSWGGSADGVYTYKVGKCFFTYEY